jgi:hypothetical protein
LRQECLCRAYVQAIAAQAGVISAKPDPDFGIDLCLRAVRQGGNQYSDFGMQLDLQLRSTTRANVSDIEVRYDLDVRTYNYLREVPPICPRLLVLLVLPDDESQSLSQSLEELMLRHCAYWLSLQGAEPKTATTTVRVTIPRSQVFSIQALRTLMKLSN